MYSARKLATAVAATLTVASFASLAQASAETAPPVGRGEAGALIPAAVRDHVPPWKWCAFADHLAAADLGPLLPATLPVSPEVQAVLLGEVTVGTDCSAYDVPVWPRRGTSRPIAIAVSSGSTGARPAQPGTAASSSKSWSKPFSG